MIPLTQLFFALLVIVNLSSARASAQAQAAHFSDSDLQVSADRIKSLDHFSPEELKAYLLGWEKKCGKVDNNEACALGEEDILPKEKARADYVFLFRGENEVFSSPAASSGIRKLKDNDFFRCGPDCNRSRLVQSLTEKFLVLSNADFDVYRSTTIVLNEKDQAWYVNSYAQRLQFDHPDELIPIGKLPSAKGHGDNIHGTGAIDFLVSSHVSATGLRVKTEDQQNVELDFMVSYSLSPDVALKFAGDHGRLIVIAVPKKNLKTDCMAFPEANELVDVNSCSPWADSYSEEIEYDALFFTPSSVISNSILTAHP